MPRFFVPDQRASAPPDDVIPDRDGRRADPAARARPAAAGSAHVPAGPARSPGSLGSLIQPVARPAPLRQTVYDALAELIADGTLAPGQHLVEAELARHLGVSRQPVREALHRLEAEGWVDLRPGHGAFVHQPAEHEVDGLLDVRCLLETEAARLAAQAAPAAGCERLRALLRESASPLGDGDARAVVAANTALHGQIAAMSGNPVLAELAGIVDWRMRWHHRLVALRRGRQSWQEHQELADVIEAGDADRAAKLMREHVELTRTAYRRHADAADWWHR